MLHTHKNVPITNVSELQSCHVWKMAACPLQGQPGLCEPTRLSISVHLSRVCVPFHPLRASQAPFQAVGTAGRAPALSEPGFPWLWPAGGEGPWREALHLRRASQRLFSPVGSLHLSRAESSTILHSQFLSRSATPQVLCSLVCRVASRWRVLV